MHSRQVANGSPPAGEQPLDSWKEIARYLGRSVRTVQSWEKHEGLPVRRHQHIKAGTVYAYPSEIEVWRESRDRLANGRGAVGATLRARVWLLIAVIAVATFALLSWQILEDRRLGSERSESRLAGGERDWLLIGNFANLTGEEALDGTLEAALRRELAGFVKVAPPERVGDTLRLMGRRVDTPVDAILAREVAQRDDGVETVLIGRVERDAGSLLLSVELLSAAEGVTTASLREVADGTEGLLPAVGSLSRQVLESLGELPAAPRNVQPPDRASTPSFQALRLYTKADRMFREGGERADRVAEQLLREAMVADPGFAPAYTHLAWALARLRRPQAEVLAEAEKAVELAARATVMERYFIRGSLYHLRWIYVREDEDIDAALAQYRALLELDPGHFWARFNSFALLYDAGRPREGLALSLRALAARPADIEILAEVAHQLVASEGDLEQALEYAERAQQLQRDLGAVTSHTVALLEFYPLQALWLEGDVEGALRGLDRIVESLPVQPVEAGDNRVFLAGEAMVFYLGLGMFSRAEELQTVYGIFPPASWERIMARMRRDEELQIELLGDRSPENPFRIADHAWTLAHLGLLEEAERQLERLPESLPTAAEGDRLAARAMLDLAAGRSADAIAGLKTSLSLGGDLVWGEYFREMQALSRALVAQGDPEQAVHVLDEASRQKARLIDGRDRTVWMEVRLQLASLHRELGREAVALEIENELRRYCALAEPEFPVLQELERRSHSQAGV